jgi:hypothetical protein
MKAINCLLTFFLSSFLLSQSGNILPGQKTAIESLSANAGFSSQDLYNYLLSEYGGSINDLSRLQGAEVIKSFQNQSIKKPAEKETTKTINRDLTVATSLEAGMQKRFHFLDGTIREGEILSIENEVIRLKTSSGTFNIPSEQFLEESAEITNKNGEFFIGSVLGETAEEFVIRTQYGDAVVQKRDIQKMKRYHGGVLDRKSEERTKFYQGESKLINVFLDPTAFPLAGNTFYLSGLSIGYGLTDRFMITSKIGSNFNNDLNLHPRMRFYHKKSAQKEVAASWGLGLHRKYPAESIVSRYAHAITIDSVDIETGESNLVPLNELRGDMKNISVGDVTNESVNADRFYIEAYLVFSSRRVNPTGRGKIGWSTGIKVSNAFLDRNEFLKGSVNFDGRESPVSWSEEKLYKVPFRAWASLEYDLRKDLKFLGSAWIDNGYRAMNFSDLASDYLGDDGTAAFSLESAAGSVSMVDFDFGLQYTLNETFKIGLHFQQPYIDFYWEFFEF